MKHIKVLSIRQPWAWLIVQNYKPVENRSWNTKHRGEFYIHASQGMTKQEYYEVQGFVLPMGIDLPPIESIERGGIVGKADLINTVHERESGLLADKDKPWFFGEYGFVLDNAQALPFMPLKGRLGFFNAYIQE